MFACFECCVLLGTGLCDELITRREESYRLWYVVVCDLENLKNEEAMTRVGSQRHSPLPPPPKRNFHKLLSNAMPEIAQFFHYTSCKCFTQHVLQRDESTSQADKPAVLSLLCRILLIGSKDHIKGRLDRTRCEKTSLKNNLIFKRNIRSKYQKDFKCGELLNVDVEMK